MHVGFVHALYSAPFSSVWITGAQTNCLHSVRTIGMLFKLVCYLPDHYNSDVKGKILMRNG